MSRKHIPEPMQPASERMKLAIVFTSVGTIGGLHPKRLKEAAKELAVWQATEKGMPMPMAYAEANWRHFIEPARRAITAAAEARV